MRTDIQYNSINQPEGEVTLSITKPKSWFGSPHYHVFVGGCGVGEAPNLKEAERLLEKRAMQWMLKRIGELEREAQFYRGQLFCFNLAKKKNHLRRVK